MGKIKKRYAPLMLAFLAFAILSMFVTGCSNDFISSTDEADASAPEKIVVGVTIVPGKTLIKAVCGDLVDVVTMVPPGSSPESYEPTRKSMEDLNDAPLYFSLGVATEKLNILPNIGSNTKIVSLSDEVADVYPDRFFESGERDPHIWLSPKRTIVMIEKIRDEMCALDPDNAAIYEANADDYIAQLNDLHNYIVNELEGASSADFIVYHPAFGYFADDYGLTMHALEEGGKQATVDRLKKMVDLAKEKDIKVIFYQEEIDSSQSQAFAEEIGGRTMQLSPLSADYIDNLKSMTAMIAGALW